MDRRFWGGLLIILGLWLMTVLGCAGPGPIANAASASAGTQWGYTATGAYRPLCTATPGYARLSAIRDGITTSTVSALDAAWVMQYVVDKRELTDDQILACDVTGDGTCSALDAARILQFVVGKIPRLPAAIACGSDFLFYPEASPGWATHRPELYGGTCVNGYAEALDCGDEMVGPNFTAILLGDVTGNWTP
jgi:hypothetical protein